MAEQGPVYGLEIPAGDILFPGSADFPATVSFPILSEEEDELFRLARGCEPSLAIPYLRCYRNII